MTNREKEQLFIIAKYLDIVQTVMSEKYQLSILKLLIISFFLKTYDYNERIIPKQSKKNLSSLFISLMENDKAHFFNDIEIIFLCLNILQKNQKIQIKEKKIINIDCSSCLIYSDFRSQIYDALSTCSDKNLLREVFNYV